MTSVLSIISAADALIASYEKAGNVAAMGPLLQMTARWKAWVAANKDKTVACRESLLGCKAIEATSNVEKAKADFETARKAAAAFGPPPVSSSNSAGAFVVFGVAVLAGYFLWKWGENKYSDPPSYSTRSY